MRRFARSIVVAMAAVMASAIPGAARAEYTPPRPTGIDIPSSQPLVDLQACTIRTLAMRGTLTPVQLKDGIAIDFQLSGMFMPATGQAIVTIEIRDANDLRHITVAYRHPFSGKSAQAFLRDTAKRCFQAEYDAASAAGTASPKPAT